MLSSIKFNQVNNKWLKDGKNSFRCNYEKKIIDLIYVIHYYSSQHVSFSFITFKYVER